MDPIHLLNEDEEKENQLFFLSLSPQFVIEWLPNGYGFAWTFNKYINEYMTVFLYIPWRGFKHYQFNYSEFVKWRFEAFRTTSFENHPPF